SERLNIVQSALSRRIAELEAELGIELFERLPRGIRLSKSGQEFLPSAELVLKDVELAQMHAGRLKRGEAGLLRIGSTATLSQLDRVSKALGRFRNRKSDVELVFTQRRSGPLLDLLENGDVDVVVGYAKARSYKDFHRYCLEHHH